MNDDEIAAKCADALIVMLCIGVVVAVAFGWIS